METNKAKQLANIKYVGKARKEKNLQLALDTMQIAIAKNTVTLGAVADKADKELSKIRKNRAELVVLKQESVANYGPLRALYNSTLKGITAESLAKEYAAKATDKKAQYMAVTKEQGAVIDSFFALKAAKDWSVISGVARVLSIDETVVETAEQGVIAETVKAELEAAIAE